MKSYSRHLLILLLFTSFLEINGQFNYNKGRVITIENDTLSGMIKDGGVSKNSRICKFKTDKKSKAITYRPDELISYSVDEDRMYHSRKVFVKDEFKSYFFDVLLEGEFNLYSFHKNRHSLFYIERSGEHFMPLINERFITKKPRGNFQPILYQEYDIENRIYKDTLYSLFKDCKPIATQIFNLEYNRKALLNITKEYIESTCTEKNCVTFEKDIRRYKARFGFFSGILLSQIHFPGGDCRSAIEPIIPVGIMYQSPLSLINEKLSLQIELIARRYKYNQDFTNLSRTYLDLDIDINEFGVPLSFNYQFSRKNITPFCGIGKEFSFITKSSATYLRDGVLVEQNPESYTDTYYVYKYNQGGWFFDIGVNFYLNPKLSLFSNLRLQRNNNKQLLEKYYNSLNYKNAKGTDYEIYTAALYIGVKF